MDSITILIPLFFFVAVLYSMVGFGGGSSYIALLILFGVSYQITPVLALVCNLIVVTGGVIYFYRSKNLSFGFIWPFVISSIPMAYLGGLIPISKELFQFLLGLSLLLAATRMLFFKKPDFYYSDHNDRPPVVPSLLIGSGLGFLSGMVGIGGGIFLAPLLYFLKWGKPKSIAATASTFILVNSLAGVAGQLQKSGLAGTLIDYWPLMLAVFFGGQIGSVFVNFKISQRRVEVLTSILIFGVSSRLIFNSFSWMLNSLTESVRFF